MRIFIDANIVFSASVPDSATRVLFNAALGRSKGLVSNLHAVQEAKKNLHLKKPEFLHACDLLLKSVEISSAFASFSGVSLPQQDYPILAGAIGSRCDYLWTGDKRHFGALYGTSIGGVTVVSSIQLAEVLLKKGWKIR